MPIVRTLLFQAARRLASDPNVRAKAAEVSRDHVLPAARKAASAAGEATRKQRQKLDQEIAAARAEATEETTRAELAGKIAGRMMRNWRDDRN